LFDFIHIFLNIFYFAYTSVIFTDKDVWKSSITVLENLLRRSCLRVIQRIRRIRDTDAV